MPKRVIDGEGLWRSDKLAQVEPPSLRGEYACLLPLALANGVFEANARRIWATVYSYNRPDVGVEQVEKILAEFERVKLLFTWTAAGKTWGYFVGIEKPGRLPPLSRLKHSHEVLGPEPPKESLEAFVHLSEPQARIAAVWVAHTHALTAASTTPYLAVTSAVKQSGKTRLLEVFNLLVAKPWLTGRVTAAVLIRKVDQIGPTLLHESDAAFSGEKEYAEALRGILNSGFYAGGVASCCVGQGANITFKDFKTYCAKAIAGIGQLPDTVADRSIPIRLQRKKPGETVARFRRRIAEHEAAEIKTAVSDWISSIVDRIKEVQPDLPDELSDRQQDGIEPLLAIADEAGHDWPGAVRKAAVEIFGSSAADDQNISVQLLGDIRAILDGSLLDKISSAELLENLKQVETSPWADWSKGKGLTANGLARLLKPFEITPRGIRVDEQTPKGYLRESFNDAFARYFPPQAPRSSFPTATPPQSAYSLVEIDFSNRNRKVDVSVAKSASNPHEHCVVAGVADRNPLSEGGDTKEEATKALSSCPVCGSFAVDSRTSPLICFTCEQRTGRLQ